MLKAFETIFKRFEKTFGLPGTAGNRKYFKEKAFEKPLSLVLASRVFLRVLRFSSLHKNQHS